MLDREDMYQYQNTTVDHIIEHTHCGVFLEMGLGKTVSSLTAADYFLYETLELDKVLVVAPKRVAENVWHREVKKWRHLNHLKVVVIKGSAKQRRMALNEKADIYVISRDNIAWLCGLYGGSRVPFDMLIIDELSSFKNSKSVRFKALKQVRDSFKRVVGLTGTPAPNGLIDLWSQMYLIDKGERLGKFITKYRSTYFSSYSPMGTYTKYGITKENQNAIHDRIKDICISMKMDDYLDLPKYIYNPIMVTFPQDLMDKYLEFEEEQVLELFEGNEDDVITAVNAAALSNKLLQFANGAIYDEDKNVHEIHDQKIEALKELVEDADGKPMIVAWAYRHDRNRIHEALKKYKPRDLKTEEDIDDWNNGKIRVLTMHPASAGHGLNLQFGGNTITWFGNTWSLELYKQLNARLRRPGQKEPTIINTIVSAGTMDINVLRALERKHESQNSLMEAVKARIKKYLS